MKVLFDQSTPRPLARYLEKHAVTLAISAGLDRTPNGELIASAEAQGFDALVTPDTNIRYQQNLKERKIAIIVLLPSGRWPGVRNQLQEVIDAVDEAKPGTYRAVPYRGIGSRKH